MSGSIQYRCLTCGSVYDTQSRMTVCPSDGTELLICSADPFIGTVVAGTYTIRSFHSAGGCASVYRATDDNGETVAVKILHDHLSVSPDLMKRFEREARALERLQHPNLVKVLGHGLMPRGQRYIIMEWLNGPSLDTEIARVGQLPVKQTVSIGAQLCDALAFAHQNGILHRDVKPSNIVLNGDTVKLIDFGFARLTEVLSTDTSLTKTGQVLGTAAYMSPEQCLGQELDVRSDLYSLGCVLFEMLTGIRTFNANSELEFMHQHVNVEPRKFAEIRSDIYIPDGLESVVRRALEKDRERRFPNIKALKASLEAGHDLEHSLTEGNGFKKAWILAGSGVVAAGMIGAIAFVFRTNVSAPPISHSGEIDKSTVRSSVISPDSNRFKNTASRSSGTVPGSERSTSKGSAPAPSPVVPLQSTVKTKNAPGDTTSKQKPKQWDRREILKMYALDQDEAVSPNKGTAPFLSRTPATAVAAPPISAPSRGTLPGSTITTPVRPGPSIAIQQAPQMIEFSNNNSNGVQNHPMQPYRFELKVPAKLLYITTKHVNYGVGAPAGRIGLQKIGGSAMEWTARGKAPMGGKVQTYWFVDHRKNPIKIYPGLYEVIDSDPETWSWNTMSGGAGMTHVMMAPAD